MYLCSWILILRKIMSYIVNLLNINNLYPPPMLVVGVAFCRLRALVFSFLLVYSLCFYSVCTMLQWFRNYHV